MTLLIMKSFSAHSSDLTSIKWFTSSQNTDIWFFFFFLPPCNILNSLQSQLSFKRSWWIIHSDPLSFLPIRSQSGKILSLVSFVETNSRGDLWPFLIAGLCFQTGSVKWPDTSYGIKNRQEFIPEIRYCQKHAVAPSGQSKHILYITIFRSSTEESGQEQKSKSKLGQ